MQDLIVKFLKKGSLINPDDLSIDKLNSLSFRQELPLVIDKSIFQDENPQLDIKQGSMDAGSNGNVEIIESFGDFSIKKSIKDFIELYNNRYIQLQSILRQRQEMHSVTSIKKLQSYQDSEQVSVIGMVLDKHITKNNNLLLTLEDPTGTIKAVITKSSKEAFELAKDVTPDEVVAVSGTKGNNIIFANTLFNPDIPLNKELKKSPIDESVIFIGDLHIGSNVFFEEEFESFISWLSIDKEKNPLSKKIKYLFIMGDLVEGIGIFPGQENDLKIKDIYEQYNKFTSYIKRLPSTLKIIICPGNHDSLRVAEPQPPIPKEMVPELVDKDNIYFVSSPSTVKIGMTDRFSGFDILIYHGFSFPYYAANIESLRLSGGLEATDNIMEYLLKKRHLAPTHGSTQYQLGYKDDPLTIKSVPDIFASGHIHRAIAKNYKNTTIINSSCWVAQTPYQEQRGLVPDPCKAVYIDLQTREIKMLDFKK